MNHARRIFLRGQFVPPPAARRPPWTLNQILIERCIGCGDCARSCPEEIIVLRNGYPEVDFTHGECTFCGRCADACDHQVFTVARHERAFMHDVAIGDACLARSGVVCQVCADTCPETAIRFSPRLGTVPAPDIDLEACTGCGACVASCPADAVQISPPATGAVHE